MNEEQLNGQPLISDSNSSTSATVFNSVSGSSPTPIQNFPPPQTSVQPTPVVQLPQPVATPMSSAVPPEIPIPPISSQKSPKIEISRNQIILAGVSVVAVLFLLVILFYNLGQNNTAGTIQPTPTPSVSLQATETPSVTAEVTPTETLAPSITTTTTPTPTTIPLEKEVKKVSITWTEPYQGSVLKWNYSLVVPKGSAIEVKTEPFEADASITINGIKLIHRFPAEIVGSDKMKKADVVTVGTLKNGRTLYRAISTNFHKDKYRYFDTLSNICGEGNVPSANETCPEWGVTYGAVNANERVTDPYIDAPSASLSDAQLKEFDDAMLSIGK